MKLQFEGEEYGFENKDILHFDKKKKGKRKWKNEFVTRVFRLLAPASARSFLVTYNADAYYVQP